MTGPTPTTTVPAARAEDPSRARRQAAREWRWALATVAVLAGLGAALGVLWQVLSPPGPLGVRLPAGIEADETGAFMQGDGRFAIIVTVVGLLAGAAAWRVRGVRGWRMAAALALGGGLGAVLTDLVAHLIRGTGRTTVAADGAVYYDHLPLQVRMTGLLALEPLFAVLVFGLCVAFAARDDLGIPEPAGAPAGVPPASGPPPG